MASNREISGPGLEPACLAKARIGVAAGLAVVALCLSPVPSAAQMLDNYIPTNLSGYDVDPGVTVTSRLRPQYASPGIRLGDVIVRPQITESIGYDAVPVSGQRGGSTIVGTDASVRAETQWSRHQLGMGVSVQDIRYLDLPRQSYTNWIIGIGGSYDIGRDTLSAQYTHFSLNQLPTGIDNTGLLQPQPYTTDAAKISYKTQLGPWTFIPSLLVAATRFADVTNPDGSIRTGAVLDRNVETASLETLYSFAPQRSAVLVVRGTTAQYLGGQPRRNYNDISVLGGLDYSTSGSFRYRALAGYQVRTYENRAFQNNSSPIVEASVIWTPTGLTTVTGTAIYRIEDANEDTFIGYRYTQARVVVDHEYLRNVLLQGLASVQSAEYFQSGARQTVYSAGASVTWLLNRNVGLTGSYGYSSSQDSSQAQSYSRNIMLLQLRLAL